MIVTHTLEQEVAVQRLLEELGEDPIEVLEIADGELLTILFPEAGKYLVWADGSVADSQASEEELLETQVQRATRRKLDLYRELVDLLLRTARDGGDIVTALQVWAELDGPRSDIRRRKLDLLSEVDFFSG